MRRMLLSVIALAALLGVRAEPGAQVPDSLGHEPMLVSVDWLAQHLNDSDLVLLQIGDRSEYTKAKIPGAQFLDYHDISTPSGQGLTLELPPVAQLVAVFERLGVSDQSHIVLYFGSEWVTPTARVYLTLDYLGLGERTSILDGGLPAWIAAGKPMTSEERPAKAGSLTPHPRPELVVDAAWVSAHLASPQTILLDARTHQSYVGAADAHERRGHIPGAANMPFETLLNDDKRLKSADELRELFRAAGVKPGETVVSYCYIGQRASLIYFVAKYLGYAARLYDGSWEDWSARKDLPIVQGADPGKP